MRDAETEVDCKYAPAQVFGIAMPTMMERITELVYRHGRDFVVDYVCKRCGWETDCDWTYGEKRTAVAFHWQHCKVGPEPFKSDPTARPS